MPKRTLNFPTKLSIRELSDFFGVSPSTAWRLVRTGALSSHCIGSRRFVYLSDAEKFIQENTRDAFDAQAVAAQILSAK